ncbi:Rpr2-domain-containing protein [Biscogniauxia marginata]|nr:Rpr2-domain-containing protein [Biscogniauxia marginata]
MLTETSIISQNTIFRFILNSPLRGMAKTKTPGGSVPNRPLYSRISFLYQAATYLGSHDKQYSSTPTTQPAGNVTATSEEKQHSLTNRARQSLSRRFLSDLRSTSLKSQIRLSPAMKHTICKFCDNLLIDGETSNVTVENSSKGGKKPWADVLVVNCTTCGWVKRYPVQATRQKRRPARQQKANEAVNQKKQGAVELQEKKVDTAMEEG